MTRYDPAVRTAAGNRARLQSRTHGSPTLRPGTVEALAAVRCTAGEHQTETDALTGDEVCRWCTQVIQ